MSHFEVPLFSITPESQVSFNIFRKEKDGYKLIVESENIFPRSLASIIENNSNIANAVYISDKDKEKYYKYLEKTLADITKNASLPLKEKSKFIYNTSSKIISDLLDKPDSKESIVRSKTLVDNTINIILSHDSSIKSIMEIGSHDYYTYTHSVDAAVFAIGFANFLNYSFHDIANVGYAAMMHDIGKSKIPSEIINKKGRLSEVEFEVIKDHPIFSYEILHEHGERDIDVLKAVRHHHEKQGGNGYPDNLIGKDIHEFAKIIAISDIFSALTTKRSYKDAYSSFEALTLMKTDMIKDIDKNLFTEFVRFMSQVCR